MFLLLFFVFCFVNELLYCMYVFKFDIKYRLYFISCEAEVGYLFSSCCRLLSSLCIDKIVSDLSEYLSCPNFST